MSYPYGIRALNASSVAHTNGTATSSGLDVSRTIGKFKIEGTISSATPSHSLEFQYAHLDENDNAGTYVSIISGITGTTFQSNFECQYANRLVIKAINTGAETATVTLKLLSQECGGAE